MLCTVQDDLVTTLLLCDGDELLYQPVWCMKVRRHAERSKDKVFISAGSDVTT